MCYSGAAFRPTILLFFSWQTKKLSATNQQWCLWLYSKHPVDMFPSFWIMKSLTFWKYSILHPTRGSSANNFTSRNATQFTFLKTLKAIDSLTRVPNFFFSDFYLSLLFKFKIGPSVRLSCLILSAQTHLLIQLLRAGWYRVLNILHCRISPSIKLQISPNFSPIY